MSPDTEGQIELFLGRRGSGKSALAEARLLRLSSGVRPIYVATLPPEHRFADTISRHRLRRGGAWNLVEAWGDIDQSCEAVLSLEMRGGVLLDGIVVNLAAAVERHGATNDEKVAESAILSSYMSFIATIARATPRLFVVTNIPDDTAALRAAPELVDLRAMHLNYVICSMLAEVGALLWRCEEGEAVSVVWQDVAPEFRRFLRRYSWLC